ncbi:hypothetical protein [Luteolibacter sp. LG18]|uniref:hypothetical protein n=1 Tax=Luteolibacter sp. LG18 TaxID=2819286 RepID=UPI002B308C6C|nr:hypothetical protein llg_29990 [Luteolibacter sp. LG18]
MALALTPHIVSVLVGTVTGCILYWGMFWFRRALARAALVRWSIREGVQLTQMERGGFFTSPFIWGGFGAHSFRVTVLDREARVLKAWVLVRWLTDKAEVRWDEGDEPS